METSSLSEEEKVAEYIRCSQFNLTSYWYWLTHYVHTLDNETGQTKLFPGWAHIRQLAEDFFTGKNIARKKSRRLLLSWFFMSLELWLISYHDTYPVFNLSYKEALVDDGTPNSLHGKIKFIYDRLPAYLQMDLTFKHLRIDCKDTGSYIVGESSNEDSGRGGGFKFGFVDEAAFLRHAETIFAAFSRACEQIAMVTTSNGKYTMFYRIQTEVAPKSPLWTYDFLHARLRPDRTEAYFQRCKDEMTALQYAREIDGDDEESIAGRVFPQFSTGLQGHVVDNLFDSSLPVELSFDFGAVPTAVKLIQQVLEEARVVGEIYADYKTPEEITGEITEWLIDKGVIKAFNDMGNITLAEYKEYTKGELRKLRAFGDPAGNARLQDGSKSLIDQYNNCGIIIHTKTKSNVELGITEVTRRIAHKKLLVDKTCTKTQDELIGCHYKADERTGEILDDSKYVHDGLSHGVDAIRYWCENNPLKIGGNIEDKAKPRHKPSPKGRFKQRLKKRGVK